MCVCVCVIQRSPKTTIVQLPSKKVKYALAKRSSGYVILVDPNGNTMKVKESDFKDEWVLRFHNMAAIDSRKVSTLSRKLADDFDSASSKGWLTHALSTHTRTHKCRTLSHTQMLHLCSDDVDGFLNGMEDFNPNIEKLEKTLNKRMDEFDAKVKKLMNDMSKVSKTNKNKAPDDKALDIIKKSAVSWKQASKKKGRRKRKAADAFGEVLDIIGAHTHTHTHMHSHMHCCLFAHLFDHFFFFHIPIATFGFRRVQFFQENM